MDGGDYVTAINREDADVTGNYTITHVSGHISLARSGQGTVDAHGYSGTYDGQAHAPWVNVSYPTVEEYTIRYSLNGTDWTTERPGLHRSGSHKVYIEVTSPNYDRIHAEVYVNISRRALTITASDATKVYDGIPLSNADCSADNLAVGDRLDAISARQPHIRRPERKRRRWRADPQRSGRGCDRKLPHRLQGRHPVGYTPPGDCNRGSGL